jgi:hypothetical protein
MTITAVRLLDGSGAEVTSFQSGDRMTVEIAFAGDAPVTFPSFGVMIHSSDGVLMYGTNTGRQSFAVTDEVAGGVIRLNVPRLHLHEGRFAVTVAAGSHDESEVFDWLDRWIEFSVFASGGGIGMVDLAPEWEFIGADGSAPALGAPVAGHPSDR